MAGILILPSISSAQTTESLQAQITALLQQLQQLQQQLAQTQGTSQKWCHTFGNNLKIESSGSEIQSSNNALANEGILDEKSAAKDDFDENIAAAVTGFQEKYKDEILTPNGLSRGTGYVGPSTRKKLNQLYGCSNQQKPIIPITSCPVPVRMACPTGQHYEFGITNYNSMGCPVQDAKCVPDSNASFSATPTSGSAPLNVAFFGTASVGLHYVLDFGDGSTPASVSCGEGCTSLNVNESHIYTVSGSYIATLKTSPEQYADGHVDVIGTVVITVADTQSTTPNATFSASPTSGTAPLSVTFSIGQSAGGQFIDFGDGTNPCSPLIQGFVRDEGGCNAPAFPQTFMHTYKAPGTYTVTASRHLPSTTLGTATVTVVGQTSDTVDLKVNGSDGPLTLTQNQKITLSWTSNGMSSCSNISGATLADTQIISANGVLPTNGSVQAWSQGSSITFGCQKIGTGQYVYDTVGVNVVSTPASLQITSPNGGEQINRDATMTVSFTSPGVKSYSLALYKNDQWKAWIVKDAPANSTPNTDRSFKPSDFLQGLGEGDNAGNIFKIYITGQRADGQGYVDDKSDAPFGFVSNATTPTPTVTLTANPASIVSGQTSTLTWSSTNATYCTGYENGSSAQYYPDKLDTNGSIPQSFRESKTYTFTCTGPGGSVTKSVTVTVTQPTATESVTLNSVTVDSSSIKVTYSKNFATCVHLLDQNTTILHTQNYFCGQGDNLTVSVPSPSDLSAKVQVGQQVKLCHGNNYSICSGLVTVTAATTDALTVTISASLTSVPYGGQSALTWSSSNATSCKFTEGDNQFTSYENTISGTNRYTQSLYASQRYTIVCTGSGGSVTKSVTVNLQPAEVAELHVVGVYQASSDHQFCYSTVGKASVRVLNTGKPIILALSSYEPVSWDISLDPGTDLQKIILGGYHAQYVHSISGNSSSNPIPMSSYTYYSSENLTQGSDPGNNFFYDARNQTSGKLYDWASQPSMCPESAAVPVDQRVPFKTTGEYYYAYQQSGSEYQKWASKLKTVTGLDIKSFQGSYSGTSFAVPLSATSANDTKQMANTLQSMTGILQNMLQSLR